MLVKNHKLHAIIDFGNMCMGDPACDLVIAWIFFDEKSRETFIDALNIDEKTWQRAKGWALWKALINLAGSKDKPCSSAQRNIELIEILLNDE